MDLAAEVAEAVSGLSRPEVGGGPAAAPSADMIAEEAWQSRGENFSKLLR
jgi:hypothetical protein